jgi:hypothetical protein
LNKSNYLNHAAWSSRNQSFQAYAVTDRGKRAQTPALKSIQAMSTLSHTALQLLVASEGIVEPQIQDA